MHCRAEDPAPIAGTDRARLGDHLQSRVAVVENGVVHLHKITITTDYGTEVEVSEGVKEGDQVILQPPVNVADGDKVNTINATAAPT